MKVDLAEFVIECLIAMLEISPVNPRPFEYQIHGTIAATIALICMLIFALCWNKAKFSKIIYKNIRVGEILGKVIAVILVIIVFVCCLSIQYHFFYDIFL